MYCPTTYMVKFTPPPVVQGFHWLQRGVNYFNLVRLLNYLVVSLRLHLQISLLTQ